MREAYVVADGEAVGLVCLSVHYKNSVMFLANDVKAHATLQRQNADGKRACRSLMISYPHFVRGSPTSTGTAHARHSQHCSGDSTKAEIRKFFAKKDSGAYPIASYYFGAASFMPAGKINTCAHCLARTLFFGWARTVPATLKRP